jgi:hypothetical protein
MHDVWKLTKQAYSLQSKHITCGNQSINHHRQQQVAASPENQDPKALTSSRRSSAGRETGRQAQQGSRRAEFMEQKQEFCPAEQGESM